MNNLNKIIDEYDLKEITPITLLRESSDNIVYSIGEKYKKILRISKHLVLDEILFEHDVIRYLAEFGYPVPNWILTKDGNKYTLHAGEVAVLFDFIQGHHVTFNDDYFLNRNKEVFEAGKSLANLANIGKKFNTIHKRTRTIFTELQRVLDSEDRFVDEFEGGVEFVGQIKQSILFAKSAEVTSGLIHNDFRPSNVIFSESGSVSCVIDFDWSCKGPHVKDLALAVLEWSFPDGYNEPHFETFDIFLEGYNSVSEEKISRSMDLYKWIMFSALSDTATFFCDRIDSTTIKKNISYSYMYRKYIYFSKLILI